MKSLRDNCYIVEVQKDNRDRDKQRVHHWLNGPSFLSNVYLWPIEIDLCEEPIGSVVEAFELEPLLFLKNFFLLS